MLIVDDHAPMREAIRVCIQRSFPELDVIEAPDGANALKRVEAHRPALVLIKINLPDANGLDVMRAIKMLLPATFIAAISIDTSAHLCSQAVVAGAADIIHSDKLFESLVPFVGAAVTLTNWMNRVKSDSLITAGLPSL